MGGGQQPVTPAVPDPALVAMLQGAQAQDLQQTQSSLSGQDSAMASMFGSNPIFGAKGGSALGASNGLASIAFAPLGMSSPIAVPR